MEKEKLYYTLFEQQKDFENIKNLINRKKTSEIIKLTNLDLPIIITGIRRCGKSSLMKIIKNKLHLKSKEYLYIDFNDDRMIDFSVNDFQKIIVFLNENEYIKKCYLFLDEIQEIEKWEKWIYRIKEKYYIFITGSNSKLSSKEISTTLTGRSINFNLYPFSFEEFLTARKIDTKNYQLDKEIQSNIKREFKKYMNEGGFPKKVIEDEKIIISELYGNILYRDIIRKFSKKLIKPIKEISLYLLSNISANISLRTFLKISGIKNLGTIKNILNSFEDSFLFFFINKYDYSMKKQILNPKKNYCIDNGFPSIVGFKFSNDYGKLLENIVFIELKRRNKDIYYFKKNKECDFVIRKGMKIIKTIQVSYKINETNKKREIGGLLEAMDDFKLKQGLILTYDQEEEIIIEKKKIKIVPVWKWLLKKL